MNYENGNKPAQSTTESKLLTGHGDARGPVGEYSRGVNIYNGGSTSATGGKSAKMLPKGSSAREIANQGYKRLAETFFGGLNGTN